MMGRRPTTRRAVLDLLQQRGPMTAAQIATALGLSAHSLHTVLAKLQAADPDAVHVSVYRRNLVTSGRWAPVWAAGPGTDASQPQPLTPAEHKQRWRQRRRADRAAALAAMPSTRGAMTGIGHIVFAATHPPARTVRELLQSLRGHVHHQTAAAAQQQ